MDNVQGRIAKRAYDLFVARGGQHGYHIEDWLQAEKDVLAEKGKTAPVKKTLKVKAPAAPKPAAAAPARKKVVAKK